MTNAANDIFRQARQGSVAAIIQVLNEKLADSGIRTRAIFADGVLQLLCEAPTADQLEPSLIAERVRQILEAIAPRNIHRVNINSRIVREQQLLWLEDINRDPENLLWSQEITLSKPSFIQQLRNDWRSRQAESTLLPTRSARQIREQRQFWRGGVLGGVTVSLLLLAGWLAYSRFAPASTGSAPTNVSDLSSNTIASADPSPPASTSANPPTNPSTPSTSDTFADAVRIAEQASQEGQTASSSAEWLTLAARWREASDLMATVPTTDTRYKTAQDRISAYRRNSESALRKAQQP
ncbi:hypothetical protein H6F43_20995 [Leptolyngbya sp. FACHB-36]|uniref:hypothetical protein n=1 Tax=Leptolyngbya sp. FACHB-36 TaxID=2692808 RepID=UPI00168042D5|nr:hypothetical protein [Leptolyngbya sp. FACHB-36]MBD2022664.1 hypothetical protein [Leptolyngbya sp. FACHB-36]